MGRPAKIRREPGEDRLIAPAAGGEPLSADVHTRWVRDTPKRIREREQQEFVMATEEDVRSDHDGWKESDETIRKGDLKLMKVDRSRFEQRTLEAEREDEAFRTAKIRSADREGDIETREGHGQRRGTSGKFISIP